MVFYSLLFGITKKKIIGYDIKEGIFKGTYFNKYMVKNDKENGRYK